MKLNPLSKLLKQFIEKLKGHQSQEEIATKLGISRRSLYTAMNPDKDVKSFKMGVLLNISAIFPITIVISRGKIRVFRWDTIVKDGFENDG